MGKFRRGKKVRTSSAEMQATADDLHRFMYGNVQDPSKRRPGTAPSVVVPRAPASPVLDRPTWVSSCIKLDMRCNACVICKWEAEANRWHDWSPWREGQAMRLKPSAPRPAFNHVDAALVAWFEWETQGRWPASSSGSLLELVDQCATFSGPRAPRRDNAMLRKSDNLVHVDQALERACAGSEARWSISSGTCRALLIARTPGVLDEQPTFAQLGAVAVITVADVRSAIKSGRKALQVELAARELVPMPARTSGLHWDIDVRRQELMGDQL